MNTTYISKRDLWIMALLWAGALGMAIAALALISAPAPPLVRLGLPGLLLLSAAFILWLPYSTYYVLSDRDLLIRCGPFKTRVSLAAIEAVHPTHNPLSSPACSLDRLHIHYRGARFGIMISPRDKRAFLDDLVARSPGLRCIDERVIRD